MELKNQAILEVKELNFSYSADKVIFKDADFSLFNGDHVGLWGANGAGKTTFLKILTGLIKPQSGNVFFEGKIVVDKDQWHDLRLKVGFVLQHPDDQLFFPEVIDDVAFGPLNQGLSVEEAKKKSLVVLKDLGIESIAHELSYELSGGQKKLVTMASVLSMSPEVLLLDEPTNGLDSISRSKIIDIINNIDKPKIIISHDAELLSMTCNKFITIHNGQFDRIEEAAEHTHVHTHFYGKSYHVHD